MQKGKELPHVGQMSSDIWKFSKMLEIETIKSLTPLITVPMQKVKENQDRSEANYNKLGQH